MKDVHMRVWRQINDNAIKRQTGFVFIHDSL